MQIFSYEKTSILYKYYIAKLICLNKRINVIFKKNLDIIDKIKQYIIKDYYFDKIFEEYFNYYIFLYNIHFMYFEQNELSNIQNIQIITLDNKEINILNYNLSSIQKNTIQKVYWLYNLCETTFLFYPFISIKNYNFYISYGNMFVKKIDLNYYLLFWIYDSNLLKNEIIKYNFTNKNENEKEKIINKINSNLNVEIITVKQNYTYFNTWYLIIHFLNENNIIDLLNLLNKSSIYNILNPLYCNENNIYSWFKNSADEDEKQLHSRIAYVAENNHFLNLDIKIYENAFNNLLLNEQNIDKSYLIILWIFFYKLSYCLKNFELSNKIYHTNFWNWKNAEQLHGIE